MAAGLTRSEQIALVGVGLLIVLGVGYQNYRATSATLDAPDSHWRPVAMMKANETSATEIAGGVLSSASEPRTEKGKPAFQVDPLDLNTATQSEIESLPGIGPVRAGDILATREAKGGFKSVDELLDVRGIGEITLEKLRPRVRVGDSATTSSSSIFIVTPIAPPALEMPSSSAITSEPTRININTASREELEKIPGVGPALADRIIAARKRKPFARPEDLIEVSGIGPKTFEKMRAWVIVE